MENAGKSSSGASGGPSGECEGEDQDESSSSSPEIHQALENLTLDDSVDTKYPVDHLLEFRQQWQRELGGSLSPQPESPRHGAAGNQGEQEPELKEEDNAKEDELSVFRSQWQRELDCSPSPQRMVPPAKEERKKEEELTEEDKAKQLFLRGVDMERSGKLYEAIQHYKRAMQILPDVETRLYESSEHRADTPEVESEPEQASADEQAPLSEDEDAVPGEDFLARMRRLAARRGRLCEPLVVTKGLHISSLPYEVLVLIARWAVSSALDACALERLAGVCRGLYVLAREPQLWRALCVKTWGIDCGTPRAHGYESWRQMYIDRPRLNLHGCYISKTTYLRHGENSFQDHFYRPWYLVDYYRYLRFFPDGVVLSWTTAEEPAACVGQLKHRQPRPAAGIMLGHYRLVRDKVVIMIKKTNSEKKPAQASNTRFRSRRKEVVENHEQTFHLELEVRTVRSRRHWQLVWRRYAVSTRRDQCTQFELSPNKYPPFAFSRVRGYTAESHAPLPHSHAIY